jgi:hypothetical protein
MRSILILPFTRKGWIASNINDLALDVPDIVTRSTCRQRTQRIKMQLMRVRDVRLDDLLVAVNLWQQTRSYPFHAVDDDAPYIRW